MTGNYDPNETPEQLAERLKKVKAFVDDCNGIPTPSRPTFMPDEIDLICDHYIAETAEWACNPSHYDAIREALHRILRHISVPSEKLPCGKRANESCDVPCCLEAPSSAIAPNGWKLVPLVPTDEMEKAAYQEDIAYSNNRYTFPSESRFYNVYAAMLRTAPEAK